MMEFREFPKIARLSRECVVTEKIDGTNATVNIRPANNDFEFGTDIQVQVQAIGGDDNGEVTCYLRAGSRTRWINTADDNHGFAKWVHANAHDLAGLGIGAHFGEWWGSGIQRGYGLPQGEKRWSLFNTSRWGKARPASCHVVPVLYQGVFNEGAILGSLDRLAGLGSVSAPSFMNPEGVIIYHVAANLYFKKTLHKDDEWKGVKTASAA